MTKQMFAALVAMTFLAGSAADASAANRKAHHAKHHAKVHSRHVNKDSSSYGSFYRTQQSYHTCG